MEGLIQLLIFIIFLIIFKTLEEKIRVFGLSEKKSNNDEDEIIEFSLEKKQETPQKNIEIKKNIKKIPHSKIPSKNFASYREDIKRRSFLSKKESLLSSGKKESFRFKQPTVEESSSSLRLSYLLKTNSLGRLYIISEILRPPLSIRHRYTQGPFYFR